MNKLIEQMRRQPLGFGMAVRMQPGAFCPMHDHAGVEIVYHPSGRGWTGMDDDSRIEFETGAVIIYPPGVGHEQMLLELGDDIVIQGMPAEPLPELCRKAVHIPNPDRSLCAEMLMMLETPLQPSPAEELAASLRVTSLYLRLMDLAQRQDAQSNRSNAARYAEGAYKRLTSDPDPTLQIADLARSVGVSSDYLRHSFRDRYGMTLKQFMMQVRIDRVKKMLEHTTLPLKAIAQSCGFENDRYLCTSFRKLTGQTPGRWRNRTR